MNSLLGNSSGTLPVVIAALAVLIAVVFVLLRIPAIRKRLPIIVLSFRKIHLALEKIQQTHGDLVPFWAGHRRMYYVNTEKGVRRVMLENRENYPKIDDVNTILRPAIGNGLLVNNGEVWARHRKALSFISHDDFKKTHFDIVVAAINRFKAVADLAVKSGDDIDLYKVIDGCTTDVMQAIVIGECMPPEVAREVMNMVGHLENQCMKLIRYHPYLPSFKRTMAILDKYLYGTIRKRRQDIAEHPEVPRYDALSRAIIGSGTLLSDEEMRDELITMIFAGHDGIALALSFATYLTAQHPDVESKIVREALSTFGKRDPTYEEHLRLTYCESVFKEGMRFYAPVPVFGRHIVEDDVIDGMKVTKGSSVIISSWTMHRNPEVYESPEVFKPERWSTLSPSAFEYLPFACPPRICIGRNFATMEAMTFLAMVFRDYTFEITRTDNPRDIDWFFALTLHARQGLWVRIRARDPSSVSEAASAAPHA